MARAIELILERGFVSIFTTVPRFYGKGLHIWLGPILLLLLIIQFATGTTMVRNPGSISNLLRFHSAVGLALFVVGLVHAYYGLGLWFFGFKYAKKKDA